MPERVCWFQGQSYHKLKRACLQRGKLFKDPLFPPSALSLFYKRAPPPGLTWKRPRELCKDPRLFVDRISTWDLHQGSLGNCWMVAATSCLASEPSLWKKVIPDHVEQEWKPKHPDLYAGIFHFRFWRLGRWTDVVVDDLLPVSEDGTLLFCRSATPREFWSTLLEKAYAKLNGCYEALEGGNTAEALIDFTGGVSEPLCLDREALTLHPDQRRALFQTLAKAHGRKALITCSIRVSDQYTFPCITTDLESAYPSLHSVTVTMCAEDFQFTLDQVNATECYLSCHASFCPFNFLSCPHKHSRHMPLLINDLYCSLCSYSIVQDSNYTHQGAFIECLWCVLVLAYLYCVSVLSLSLSLSCSPSSLPHSLSLQPAEGERVESVLDCGLVRGHAYGITAVRKVRLGEWSLLPGRCSGTFRLGMVRMRNPWGTADWTGPWSQGSQQWQQVGRGEREKMGLIVRDVGEFWMEFEDFCRYFTDVVVCRPVERALLWPSTHWREVRCHGEWVPAPNTPGATPATLLPGRQASNLGKNTAKRGEVNQTLRGDRKEARLGKRRRGRGGGGGGGRDKEGEVDGRWDKHMDKRSRCGGCINHKDTFLHNPQFMFEVQGKEDEVLICLQQEDRRIKRKDGGGANLPIGFEVLRVEVNRLSRVQCVVEQAASSVYMDSRSVALRVTLVPGRYALLPTTFQPRATGRFLLRLFSHSHLRLSELREELPALSVWQCCLPQSSVVTTVHLRRACGLSQPKQTAPDVYAVICCEDDTIRTRVFKEDGNPEFNMRAIFYRRYPDAHISIKLWSRGLLWDTLLGGARLQTGDSERGRSQGIDLQGGQSRSGYRGCIYVETSSSKCLTDL
ncbi:calpain-5-like [Salmo trutta]|uniref:calpain-5-like n=1 Tax=Salmo trutta TaxID=8032 RepID=UPI0011306FFD|nr:calpain-5-like [Salmo trutta]